MRPDELPLPESAPLDPDLLARIADDSPHIPPTETQTDVEVTEGVDPNLSGIAEMRGSGGWTRTNDLRLMKPPL